MTGNTERTFGGAERASKIYRHPGFSPADSRSVGSWVSANNRRSESAPLRRVHDNARDTRANQRILVAETNWRTAVLCVSSAALCWGASSGLIQIVLK